MSNLYILDPLEKPVGILNPSLPGGCPFFDDIHTERLENSLLTFEFEVPANHETVKVLETEGYIVYPRTEPGKMDLFKIKEITDNHSTNGELKKHVFCENAAVSDLLSNVVRPAKLNSYNLEQALNYVLQNTDWAVDYVEFQGLKDIELDYCTSLEALNSILEAFGAEPEYYVAFNGLKVTGKKIRALRQRGQDTKKIFTYGLNLQEAERKEASTELVTALVGVGRQDNQGNYLTFTDYQPRDLDVTKYEKGEDWIGSKEAFQRWSRNGRHIYGIYKDDTAQNPKELFDNTLKKLDEVSKPRFTYTVKVALLERLLGLEAHKVNLGDTVIIKDVTLQPELIIAARIIEKKISITSPEKDEVTLGEFTPAVFNDIRLIKEINRTIKDNKPTWDDAKNRTEFHIIANGPQPLIDGDYRQYSHHMNIEVTENIHIGYTSIFAESDNTPGIIELRDSANNPIEKREVTLSRGENRINLDFLLKKDIGQYRLYGSFQGNTWRTTQGLGYPYDSGTFKVTGSSSSENYWYHFYNIEISGPGVTGSYGRELRLGNTGNRDGTFTLLNLAGETAITIDNESIGIDKLVAGEVHAPNVATILTPGKGKTYFIDAVNGSDENDGLGQDRPFATFQRAIDVLPRILDDNVNFHIESDLTENITISGFLGQGTIYVNAYPYKIIGTVKVDSCKVRVDFTATDFYRVDGEQTAVVQIHKSDYVYFNYCRFFGKRGTGGNSATFAAYDNSFCYLTNCELYGANRENIRSSYGARTMVFDCSGGDSNYGCYAEYAGLVGIRGTIPAGSTPTGSGYGGQIIGTPTTQSGTAPTPTTPPKISVWYSTSGNSWRTKYNSWRNDGTVRQGQYGGYGLHTGVWLWGSGVSDAVTGKNITRARVYLTRKSQGGSAARQTVYIRWHSYLSYPSGQPSMSSDYVTASFGWGDSRWVALPASFIDAFKSGQAKGIGIYAASGSYMIFDDSARLEFTYS